MVNPLAVRVDLCGLSTAHNVFHVSKLTEFHPPDTHRFPGRRGVHTAPGPDPAYFDEGADDVYTVEAIIGKKQQRGQTKYLVKWQGWDQSHATYIPQLLLQPKIGG